MLSGANAQDPDVTTRAIRRQTPTMQAAATLKAYETLYGGLFATDLIKPLSE